MSKYENELRKKLDEKGWTVIRSAGSMGEGDLVALKPDKHLLIEVKKTSKDTFYTTNSGNKEQWEMMKEHSDKGLTVIYAVRFTRGEKETRWQIYSVDDYEDYPIFKRGEGLKLKSLK